MFLAEIISQRSGSLTQHGRFSIHLLPYFSLRSYIKQVVDGIFRLVGSTFEFCLKASVFVWLVISIELVNWKASENNPVYFYLEVVIVIDFAGILGSKPKRDKVGRVRTDTGFDHCLVSLLLLGRNKKPFWQCEGSATHTQIHTQKKTARG